MAFDLAGWTFDRVQFGVNTASGSVAIHRYKSSSDDIATILTANYFNFLATFAASANPVLFANSLVVNDLIYVSASDTVAFLRISNITDSVITVVTANFPLATGSVDTSELADGAVTNVKVNASAAIDFSKLATLTDGNLLVGNASNVATSVAMSGDATIINSGALTIANDAVTTAKILDANVTGAKLETTIQPESVVKFSGRFPTVGGDTSETISVPGVITTDNVFINVHTQGATPVTVSKASCGTDQIDVVMSADPSNDHILQYIVTRHVSI